MQSSEKDILLETEFDGFLLSTDKSRINIETVHGFLDIESYWARGIPADTLRRSIEHSICLGVYLPDGSQVGFGRMITDRATFAYLADIFVVKAWRGKGISKEMMNMFCRLADDFGLRRFLLTTQDAHGLYRQSGFELFPYPERLMSRVGVVYTINP
jgi:GNAT superfamily N-acetyltransferase